MMRSKIEEAVFKMLGHGERKRILRIISSAPEGVNYSGILSESGLATNKLNYQLKVMEGFIVKEEGVYRLSPLGLKAVGVLDYLRENLDEEAVGQVVFQDNERSEYIRRNLNGFFKFIAAVFLIGPVVAAYIYFSQPGQMPPWAIGLIFTVCGGTAYLFNRLRVSSPPYMLGFVDWLDWKFFDGNGVKDFRGKKVFVMAVMGLIIGALFGKTGLGLIVGSFLGAAMEL
ncbi:MAG: hypothetical protein NWE89_09190 [Candidatus Bathyarchaeota archaeon]|nr:hypothetical protein [Candidatus Bathyarchaeota archaeon]